VRSALVDWYDVNHRQLPWRVNRHSRRAGGAGGAQTSSWTAAAVDTPAPAGLSSCDFAYGVLVRWEAALCAELPRLTCATVK